MSFHFSKDGEIAIDGQWFGRSIARFSFARPHRIACMSELAKLAGLVNLRNADFYATNINDEGLRHLANASTIDYLNLQETEISNEGLGWLAGMPRLAILRLKDNPQLNNECVDELLKLGNLVQLEIQETSIDQDGLDRLAPMTRLRDICVDLDGANFSYARLLALSRRMPECEILVKGNGTFSQGAFDGKWKS